MKLALVLGAYDLNFSTTLSKLDIVLQWHLGFLKGMFREDIEPLYVLFVFIYISGKCLIFVRDWDTQMYVKSNLKYEII